MTDPFDRLIYSCYICRTVWHPGDDGKPVKFCPDCQVQTVPAHPETRVN